MKVMSILVWLIGAGLGIAQDENRHTSPADVKRGATLYRLRCAECHGEQGEGGRGPDLAQGVFYHGDTDASLFRTILNGINGTEMGGTGPQEDVWRLVAFVRSLNPSAEPSELPGDPAQGARLFREKQCLDCHRVGREGTFGGPDLSRVGNRRSLEFLEASIVDPNDHVQRQWWVATVTEASGEVRTGFILNEDTHSVQLLDFEGRLVSLQKMSLEGIELDRNSRCKSYDGVFDGTELADLVSYLATLRKESSR